MHPKPEEEILPPPASSNAAESSTTGDNVPVDTNLIQLDGLVLLIMLFSKQIKLNPCSAKPNL